MKKLLNIKGLTLTETIVSLGVVGIVTVPLLSMLILCQKVLSISENEYESIQTAQYYMEEIKAMDVIDSELYSYNAEEKSYERIVLQNEGKYGAEIRIMQDEDTVLYNIEIDIIDEGKIINSLAGSVIFE
jgi:Tfp pilus assembly protein PilV